MITNVEFPDGIEMPPNTESMQAKIIEMMVAHETDLQVMPIGVYDVTPKIWTKHTHDHELVVLDNGRGLYRIFPRNQRAGFVESGDAGGFSDFHKGWRSNPINEESPVAVIAGGHPHKSELQIFGVIAYLMGEAARF